MNRSNLEISASNTMESPESISGLTETATNASEKGSNVGGKNIYEIETSEQSTIYRSISFLELSHLDQMSKLLPDGLNIDNKNIDINEKIGSGEFGDVYRGVIKDDKNQIQVALKLSNKGMLKCFS